MHFIMKNFKQIRQIKPVLLFIPFFPPPACDQPHPSVCYGGFIYIFPAV